MRMKDDHGSIVSPRSFRGLGMDELEQACSYRRRWRGGCGILLCTLDWHIDIINNGKHRGDASSDRLAKNVLIQLSSYPTTNSRSDWLFSS